VSFDVLVARARGLASRAALAPVGSPRVVEDLLRERATHELAILRRWGGDAVRSFELDEDRHTLRAIARGLVANIGPAQRVRAAIPTSSLPRRLIDLVANAATFADIRTVLDTHPLAEAFGASELFDVEHALARLYVANTCARDGAFAVFRSQLVDSQNVLAALLLAARGGDLARDTYFLAGGERLDRKTFVAAASSDDVRTLLARVFAGTPIAAAVFAPAPAAVEDAALAWELATQTRLRRSEPLGLAPVLWLVLRRRDETRRLRHAAWNAVLGGGA
jgi:hypothetical protein